MSKGLFRVISIIATLASLPSCVVLPDYPGSWPAFDSEISGCPVIEGTYLNVGQAFNSAKNLFNPISFGQIVRHEILVPLPAPDPNDPDVMLVRIARDEQATVSMVWLRHGAPTQHREWTYSAAFKSELWEKTYVCEKGAIRIRSHYFDGGTRQSPGWLGVADEGYLLRTASDKSLIVEIARTNFALIYIIPVGSVGRGWARFEPYPVKPAPAR